MVFPKKPMLSAEFPKKLCFRPKTPSPLNGFPEKTYGFGRKSQAPEMVFPKKPMLSAEFPKKPMLSAENPKPLKWFSRKSLCFRPKTPSPLNGLP